MDSPAIMVEEPPAFERRDGLVYVTNARTGASWVMRFPTFYALFHNAALCIQQCNDIAASAEVIEVEFTSKFERVYPTDKSA